MVDSNLENFDSQYRSALSAGIIRGNSHLQDYINSHPLAAKVSNDDWANLDGISEKLHKLRVGMPNAGSIAEAGMKGFIQGLGDSPMGAWTYDESLDPIFGKPTERNRLSRAITSVILSPAEGFLRTLGALPTAVKEGASEAHRQFVGEKGAESFGREAAAMTEWAMMRGEQTLAFEQLARSAKEFRAVEEYLKEGKEPPVGLHPAIDAAKEEQAKQDVKNMDELLKDAQQSTTRERDPEMFANFVGLRTDAKIYIDGEAARKLYGEKLPQAEDNLLGFVPRIEDQLKLSQLGAGDIEVPLAQWLAHVDPEVAKALHDDVRVRPGGVTLNEAKLGKEQEAAKPEPVEGAPEPYSSGDPAVDAVRQGAALEPLIEKHIEAYHGTPHEFEQFAPSL